MTSTIPHNPPVFTCNDWSLGYGSRSCVLHGVNVSLAVGEVVALLGPNGSGKSTLLSGICGALKARNGQAFLSGIPIEDLSPARVARLCAVVPQRVETLFGLRVRTMVAMGRHAHLPFWGHADAEDEAVVDHALEATGMVELQNRTVNGLSGGELQRVLLARALAQQAGLLLLDEAFSAMDMAWRVRCFDLVRELEAATTVVALHDINLAALYCTRIIFLKNGRVAYDGPVEPLFSESTLSELYETTIKIGVHPGTGTPQAFAMPSPVRSGLLEHDRSSDHSSC